MITKHEGLDYDLKRILLAEMYNESEPIKNILNGKLYSNDSKEDYSRFMSGHVENYHVVNDVFSVLYPHGDTTHKDVMNSFWTTYKHYLQIEYNDVFMPDGSISGSKIPLRKPVSTKKPSTSYPPFSYGEHKTVGDAYTSYYEKNFPDFNVAAEDSWFEFLLNNFHQFMNVHGSVELNTFAKRTHTIGNICVVPKGFNGGRGASDYWDWALVFLRGHFMTFAGWDPFIEAHFLHDYVNEEDATVIPFWDNHLSDNKQIPNYPQTRGEIMSFLSVVNRNIRNRGERIMQRYEQEITD